MHRKKNYIADPGTLKIDLMLRGVRIEDPLIKAYTCGSSGIDVLLPRDTMVNIPCAESFTNNSPYVIRKKGGAHVITDGSAEVDVRLVEPPEFLNRKSASGVPFSKIVQVRGALTVVTPSPRCDFFKESVECRYCAGNFNAPDREDTVYSEEDVLEAVEAALKERSSHIIYLSIGFSDTPDGGIEFLKPYLKAIKKRFNCLVAVEALPPKENRWIDETYASGADSVLYNLEIFDKELFELICPGRAKEIGRKRYLDALEYAARIFPSGTVASHLIVGLEPPGSTCMGIDYMTDIGVVPVLPIYRPTGEKALRIDPLTTEIILPVYKHLYTAISKKKISINWVRDLSMASTPAELRSFVDKGVKAATLAESFYKTGLGRKAAWGLSALRRKLRVKEIEDKG
ncbi:MAG: radical SAM protein [Deltaproteobacteria bacterium]